MARKRWDMAAAHMGHVGSVGSITFTRPPAGSPFDLDAASGVDTPAASEPAFTWDPATKTAAAALSDGDLTVTSTSDSENVFARSTTTNSTGNRAARIVHGYSGQADSGEVAVGVAGAAWDPLASGPTGGFMVDASGYPPGNLGEVAPGTARILLIRFDDGEAWLATDANIDTVAADAEARTNPHKTFTPNTEFCLAANCYSADNSSPASATIVPSYSVGTFSAWSE